MVILFNNQFVEKDEMKVSIFSTAFMYGYGVFETLRTYDGAVFKAVEHVDRLFNSADAIDLKICYSVDEVMGMISKVVQKSGLGSQRLKVIAFDDGVIVISELLDFSEEIYAGVECCTVVAERFLPKVKSMAYLSSYLSHDRAVKQGSYEAILVDEFGMVFEGAYSNLFWFEGEVLCTRKDDVLEGITRGVVMGLSPFKVEFKNIKIDQFLKVEEVFITQTTKGIVPVVKLNGVKIAGGEVGERTKKMISLFERYVAGF